MSASPEDVRTIFRKNLVHYRQRCGYSQVELSRRCDYQKSYIGKIERGDAEPSLEALQRIARELNVTLLKLLVPENPSLFPMIMDESESIGTVGSWTGSAGKRNKTESLLSDQGPVGLLLLSPTGRILRVNETFREMLGYDSVASIADDVADLLENQDWDEFRRLVESARNDEPVRWFESSFVSGDRETLPCLVCPNQSREQAPSEEQSLQRELFPLVKGEKPRENIEIAIVNLSLARHSSSVEL